MPAEQERREWQADRDQIAQTLLDFDLSEVWLRSKVQQLLAQADLLEAELLAAQEREKVWKDAHVSAVERYKNAEEREKALREFFDTWRALQLAYQDDRDEDVYALSDGLDRQAKALAASPSEKPGSALLESAQGLSDPGMADAG